jgi:hypothetical protein
MTLELRQRPGSRPAARPVTPHQQLTQNAPAALQDQLWQRMAGLPHVRTGASTISLPDTRALHLDPRHAAGPPAAFVPGSTEFGHLHGVGDGSLHVCLPEPIAAAAIEKGWAELHPAVRMGLFPPTLVMLYGPRDEAELETVWDLVQASYAFAAGRRPERSHSPTATR